MPAVTPAASRRAYEMRHTVSFEETNLVGNVYYANHVRWQGRCREMFLRDSCPGVLRELAGDLALVTLHCSCDYLAELEAFDEVRIAMYFDDLARNRLTLRFEYFRVNPDGSETLCARGTHQVAAMRRTAGALEPCPLPEEMVDALGPYRGGA